MQQSAVECIDGPLLILAGAGSGKTTVLINRIAHILTTRKVYPSAILAITFTNKAAGELKSRLCAMLGDSGNEVAASTFHAACVKMLRRDIDKLGYSRSFGIIDRTDQINLVKSILQELNIDAKKLAPNMCLNVISSAKDKLIDYNEFAKQNEQDKSLANFIKIYKLYQTRLKAYNNLDFDDIIMLTVKLLEQEPEILSFYQNKFKYILVDEYQDTNFAQYKLIAYLAALHQNICVVGDDDQSIYKFRGADITNILNFEKQYPGATTIKLEENYRSTQSILNAANHVIHNNKRRKDKSLWTKNESGSKLSLHNTIDEFKEAEYIADKIEERYPEMGSYNDFAILYRTNAQSRVIEEKLVQKGIPYRVIGGLRFYDRKEIKDIVAYIKLMLNPNDDISLKRIINVPKRGIGDASLSLIETMAFEQGVSMLQICANSKDYADLKARSQKLTKFAEMVMSLEGGCYGMEPADAINHILEKTGYLQALEAEAALDGTKREENMSRAANLSEFVSAAAQYQEKAPEATLPDFIENISLMSDIDNHDPSADAVALLTIHSSKGLEFTCVFIAGIEEGVFPSSMAVGYDAKAYKQEELEEERRLCYVGITRAKKYLYLSHANSRAFFNERRPSKPSIFLSELPEDLVEQTAPPKRKSPIIVTGMSRPSGDLPKPIMPKAAKPKAQPIDLALGDAVKHRKFGEGTITSINYIGDDAHVEVDFADVGKKQLMAAFAKLTKL